MEVMSGKIIHQWIIDGNLMGISWDNGGFSIGLIWGSPSWNMGFLGMMVVLG
jgi:hypothetical protein